MKRLKALAKAAGLDGCHFTAHSFRRGGATGLLQAGTSEAVLRHMGRWSSNAYLRYAVVQPSTLQEAATALSGLEENSSPPRAGRESSLLEGDPLRRDVTAEVGSIPRPGRRFLSKLARVQPS